LVVEIVDLNVDVVCRYRAGVGFCSVSCVEPEYSASEVLNRAKPPEKNSDIRRPPTTAVTKPFAARQVVPGDQRDDDHCDTSNEEYPGESLEGNLYAAEDVPSDT